MLGFLRPAFDRLVVRGKLAENPFQAVKISKADSGRARARHADSEVAEVNYLARTEDEAKSAALYERDESDPDPLTDDEMLAVLEHCDPQMRDHFSFAFMAGTRTGEQLALRARDYDRHNSRVRVRRSQSRGVEGRTKTFTERWVNLNPVARAVVERQLARCRTPDDYLFVNAFTGQPWSGPNKATKRWTRALKAAGVRYRRPYHTRHTYATLMLLAGESPYYVAAQLRHTDLEMLEKRYARFIEAGRARKPGSAMAQVHAATLEHVAKLVGADMAPKA